MSFTGEKTKKYCYTNPKTKKVVAGYSDYKEPVVELRNKLTNDEIVTIGWLIDDLWNYDFEASATCDEHDAFNEKIGRTVAIAKSDMKYHKAMKAKYDKILRHLSGIYAKVLGLRDLHNTKYENCKESIAKYMPENWSDADGDQ